MLDSSQPLHPGILLALARDIEPRRKIPTYQWLQEIGYQVKGSRYSIESTPYLKDIFDATRDSSVRSITAPCPVQTGKTIFIQGVMLEALLEQGDDIIYYAQDVDAVSEFSETRFTPDYEKHAGDQKHSSRDKTKRNLIVTRRGNWVSMLSGDNIKHRRSRSARIAINDEVAVLKDGAASQCGRRTTAYQTTNALHILISTPEDSGFIMPDGQFRPTDFYSYWEDSTKHVWHIVCPSCGGEKVLDLPLYKWETNELTKPGGRVEDDRYVGGRWDWKQVQATMRWQCECEHQIEIDTPEYREMLATGHYVRTNELADDSNRGYHYPGFAVKWFKVKDVLSRFIKATELAKTGLHDQLRTVITNEMGEFWKPRQGIAEESTLHITGGYMLGLRDWEDEHINERGIRFRNLTVDVQKDHFYAVIRAWAKDGRSRLLHVQVLYNWEEIAELQKAWDIYEGRPYNRRRPSAWKAGRVFIDAGWARYQQFKGDSEVHRFCAKYNWYALRGQDCNKFTVTLKRGVTIDRYYSKIQRIVVAKGTYCMGFSFANQVLCGHLDELRQGHGLEWGIPDDAPDFYLRQLMNKQQVVREDGRGVEYKEFGEDHCFDCFKDNVKVLTSSGWKLFKDISGEETLATCNLETDTLEFQRPVTLIKKRFKGDLVRLLNSRLDLSVTPTHRIVLQDGTIKKANELTKTHDRLKSHVKHWKGVAAKKVKLGHKEIDPILAARVVGWFVADGHLNQDGVVFTKAKEAPRKTMIKALKEAGLNFTGSRQLRVGDKELHDQFKESCLDPGEGLGAYRKRIPRWLLDSDIYVLKAFFEAYSEGDGWETKQGRITTATTSPKLAEDMAELIVKLGTSTIIKVRRVEDCQGGIIRGKEISAKHDQYWTAKEQPRAYSLRDSRGNSSIQSEPYDGFVYCATVPNGTLVIMDAGGRTLVAGNCEKMQLPQAYSDGMFPVSMD